MPYTLTVTGHPDAASAATIHAVLIHARRVALAGIGPELLTITIAAPDGFCCPFAVSADPDQVPADFIEAMVNQVLWDVRAVLHFREDTHAAADA